MTCRELVEGLRAHLDSEDGLYHRVLVFLHLALCSACRAYVKSYRHTCRLVVGSAAREVETALPDDLFARLRGSLPRPDSTRRPEN